MTSNAPDNATPHGSFEYDHKVRQTIPFYETIHSEAVDLVQSLRPDVSLWLDTGCGTGHTVDLALTKFPDTRFLLADPAQAMLDQSKARLRSEIGGRVEILPPVASQDLAAHLSGRRPQVITAIQCHHYLDRAGRRAALESCFQVLDERGALLVCENIAPISDDAVQTGLARWGRFQRAHGRDAETVAQHLTRYGQAYHPITVREHMDLLDNAGFRVVELFWFAQMQAGLYAIK